MARRGLMRTNAINRIAPAVLVALTLASCAGPAAGTRSGALDVRVVMSGGPQRPDGTMALSDSPVPSAAVSALDHGQHRFSGRTDADGLAVLRLPAGRYTITATPCG